MFFFKFRWYKFVKYCLVVFKIEYGLYFFRFQLYKLIKVMLYFKFIIFNESFEGCQLLKCDCEMFVCF